MESTQPQRKKWLRIAGNIVFYGLLATLLLSSTAKSWMLKQLLAIGLFNAEISNKTAPTDSTTANIAFPYKDASGQSFSTADLKGKVVFINFWATWCPPCRAEMPELNSLYSEFKNDEDFVFLFISEDDSPATAKKYLDKNKFSMPLATRSGNISPLVYSGTLPTTVVLNKKGELVYKNEGLASYNTSKFKQQLKALQ